MLDENRPDFIFHLAAQQIVSVSFFNPEETITTNTIGMMNICEALRTVAWPCTCILITSDKVYDNVEWVWGYKETDALGGKDIYSGSKGAAELIAKSYISSFSKEMKIHSISIYLSTNRKYCNCPRWKCYWWWRLGLRSPCR